VFSLGALPPQILNKISKLSPQLSMLRFSVLLNKVWGLEGCPSKGQPVRTNRSVRFDFCGGTVLLAFSGDQVSFYTTVGGGQ
jgi:hypothetical protein